MKVLLVIFAIFASTSALGLNCEFRVVSWLAFGLNYQCYSEPYNVDSNKYLTDVWGDHLENKTHDDVVSIHIDNCTDLTYVPKGLLGRFPKLRGIYLEGCGIRALTGTELNEYPELTLFALELSPLVSVPENFFARTPGMVLVSFADNEIESVGPNLLDNLNDLTQAYFENNICISKNANVTEALPDLIATLKADCSGASGNFQSVLLIALISGYAFFENIY